MYLIQLLFDPKNYFWVQSAILGLILTYALIARKANFNKGTATVLVTCAHATQTHGDGIIFGGAAGFDFGIYYGAMALIAHNLGLSTASTILARVALLSMITTVIQTLWFISYLRTNRSAIVAAGRLQLLGHDQTCTFIAAKGLLWLLYLIKMLTGTHAFTVLHDIETKVAFVFSLPWTIIVLRPLTSAICEGATLDVGIQSL